MIFHNLNESIVDSDTDRESYETQLSQLLSGVPSVGITENLAQSVG
jgi:hypothetical protein